MRLRELTDAERAELDRRRAEARATLARIEAGWVPGEAALADAPFLDDFSERRYPGSTLRCLEGFCWGHPVLGDTIVRTSPILHRGPTWALTENRLYILGREHVETPEERGNSVRAGRRGPGRLPMAVLVVPGLQTGSEPFDDDLPEPTDTPEGTEP